MSEVRENPRPGERYRHFKNKLYQIVTVARHSETGEKMVVYQALYGSYQVWVRPLSMFMEEVDREKYPEARQKYRFERLDLEEMKSGREAEGSLERKNGAEAGNGREDKNGIEGGDRREAGGAESEEREMNPHLLAFFDAMDQKNYDKMLEALRKLSQYGGQKEMDDLYMVLDMKPATGSILEQAAAVRSQLLTMKKFNGERLR